LISLQSFVPPLRNYVVEKLNYDLPILVPGFVNNRINFVCEFDSNKQEKLLRDWIAACNRMRLWAQQYYLSSFRRATRDRLKKCFAFEAVSSPEKSALSQSCFACKQSNPEWACCSMLEVSKAGEPALAVAQELSQGEVN